jgi:glyoxylase I family protein
MDVIGLDHIYLAVSDFAASEAFYDAVMQMLGFYKGDRPIGGERHAHYFNRALQLSIRPARSASAHDSYAPGLHHLCFQVSAPSDVDAACASLGRLGIAATAPRTYPEYSEDYYATFFTDPDGIRLEIVARRHMRDEIVREWDQLRSFLNPLQELRRERASSSRGGAGRDER